jgi:hypothetical protein
MLLLAVIGWRLVQITPGREPGDYLRHRQTSTVVLIGSALLAMALSFISPRLALWALAFNFAAPLIKRWKVRQSGDR